MKRKHVIDFGCPSEYFSVSPKEWKRMQEEAKPFSEYLKLHTKERGAMTKHHKKSDRKQREFLKEMKKKFSEPLEEPKEVPLNREHITLLAWVRP
jgi:hypothetical protein